MCTICTDTFCLALSYLFFSSFVFNKTCQLSQLCISCSMSKKSLARIELVLVILTCGQFLTNTKEFKLGILNPQGWYIHSQIIKAVIFSCAMQNVHKYCEKLKKHEVHATIKHQEHETSSPRAKIAHLRVYK